MLTHKSRYSSPGGPENSGPNYKSPISGRLQFGGDYQRWCFPDISGSLIWNMLLQLSRFFTAETLERPGHFTLGVFPKRKTNDFFFFLNAKAGETRG